MGRQIDAPIMTSNYQSKQFTKKISQLKKRCQLEQNSPIIVSSPLKRCLQTARLARKEIKEKSSRIIIDNSFIETDMGDFSKENGSRLKKRYGEKLIHQWMYSPETFAFPGGESYHQVTKRVKRGLMHLVTQYRQRNIFIVTHVDIIKIILLKIVLRASFNYRRKILIPNGSISIVKILPKKEFLIEGININI